MTSQAKMIKVNANKKRIAIYIKNKRLKKKTFTEIK